MSKAGVLLGLLYNHPTPVSLNAARNNTSTPITIPITLFANNSFLYTFAMIDSGASISFIHKDLAYNTNFLLPANLLVFLLLMALSITPILLLALSSNPPPHTLKHTLFSSSHLEITQSSLGWTGFRNTTLALTGSLEQLHSLVPLSTPMDPYRLLPLPLCPVLSHHSSLNHQHLPHCCTCLPTNLHQKRHPNCDLPSPTLPP